MSDEKENSIHTKLLNICKVAKRRLRLVKINRNLLVYLIFLSISVGFWCLQTLKEDASHVFDITIDITGVPKNIIFTSEAPGTIKVSVEGRGFDFLQHFGFMSTSKKKIVIPFDNMQKKNGKATADAALIRRFTQKALGSNLTVTSCTPNNIELFYCTGKKKRVPVLWGGKVNVGMQHVLCDIKISPDSVDIYAPKNIFNSIHEVYTDNPIFKNVEDTITRTLKIKHIHGVKIVPDTANVKICVDLFTEKEISVPIYCENIPQNKVLRTFPMKANVSFHVSATMFNKITENDFLIVVDYNSIKKGDEKCQLILRSQPAGISHVEISPEYVEYIIEQAD